jgi:prohibitin 2
MTFGRDFTNAVEQKQIAQQEAQRAAFVVDRAIQEKQSIIVKAEGEARSAELIGEGNTMFSILRIAVRSQQ